MTNPVRIVVVGNGPSAYSAGAKSSECRSWEYNRIFRTNYFFLNAGDPFEYNVSDWFICEDVHDCRAVRAWDRAGSLPDTYYYKRPTIWIPGLHKKDVHAIETNHLAGFDVRVQKTFAKLPAACRWERDLRPYRPLMGSYAIAVAVGMQPDELFLCGHDLFKHESKQTHAGASAETRDWQTDFNKQYLLNRHRNHRLDGDVEYIGNALRAYEGKLSAVGSVLKKYFAKEFASRNWDWIEG